MALFCGLDVFATAPTLAFSHCQYTRDQSGAPPCVRRFFESGENASETNSRDATSAETAWRTCGRWGWTGGPVSQTSRGEKQRQQQRKGVSISPFHEQQRRRSAVPCGA